MKEKKRKPYPTRIYKEDADKLAIILLRDCGNMSFKAITLLLGYKESSKRNVEWVYNHNKDKKDKENNLKYKCQQTANLKNKINGVI